MRIMLLLVFIAHATSTATTTKYTLHANANSFTGYGGIDIDTDNAPVRMTVAQCQHRCTDDPACDCVTYAPNGFNSAWGRCWKRKQCESSKFKRGEGIFDVYMKSPVSQKILLTYTLAN